MKHVVASLTVGLALASSALAGVPVQTEYWSGKNTITDIAPPEFCPCYTSGWEFGGHFAALFQDGNGEDAIGGGITLAYFFTDRLGIETGYSVFDTDSQQHRVTLDGIYRIPFVSCFAPYVRVGGGLAANGSVDGLLRGGVGLEYKMERWNCSSIFIDGTYNWVNSRPNETITRIGFKINF